MAEPPPYHRFSYASEELPAYDVLESLGATPNGEGTSAQPQSSGSAGVVNVEEFKFEAKALELTLFAPKALSGRTPTYVHSLPIKGKVVLNLSNAEVIQEVTVSVSILIH
mgnify:CR=1 FL=1